MWSTLHVHLQVMGLIQVDIYMEASNVGTTNAKRAAAWMSPSSGTRAEHPNAASFPLVINAASESAQWLAIGSAVTDTHGRLVFPIPEEHRRPLGVHRIRMVVRYCLTATGHLATGYSTGYTTGT